MTLAEMIRKAMMGRGANHHADWANTGLKTMVGDAGIEPATPPV